jgi:hypothetical protein
LKQASRSKSRKQKQNRRTTSKGPILRALLLFCEAILIIGYERICAIVMKFPNDFAYVLSQTASASYKEGCSLEMQATIHSGYDFSELDARELKVKHDFAKAYLVTHTPPFSSALCFHVSESLSLSRSCTAAIK